MLTTITVNGSKGFQFLDSLVAVPSIPAALVAIIASIIDQASTQRLSHDCSVEVEPRLAEEIAAFVDDLLGVPHEPPLLFSAHAGDLVVLVRDALVEMQLSAKAVKAREPRTWRHLARGTRGRFVERRGDFGKVLILDGPEAHEHAFVSDRSMTRARPGPRRS
ncbi:MAG: hypothetical protein ABI867_19355 [Kofleriaceae bacterium]